MFENEVEILLVEDNAADIELTLDALRENRVTNRIQVVRNGVEALDFIFLRDAYAQKTYHNLRLILLDLKLPKIDGLEVLRQIRANEQTRLIPVVMLTSSREDRDILESYHLGVNSYIVKPVDFEQFTEATRQIGLYWLLLNQPPRTY